MRETPALVGPVDTVGITEGDPGVLVGRTVVVGSSVSVDGDEVVVGLALGVTTMRLGAGEEVATKLVGATDAVGL